MTEFLRQWTSTPRKLLARSAQGYWRAWRQMPVEERRLLASLWLQLQMAALCLRCLGLNRTIRLLAKRKVRAQKGTATPARLAELTLKSARYSPWGSTCLAQALVLRCILGDFGFQPVSLILGWKARQGFAAHAWLKCEGEALLVTTEELSQYVRFLEQ